MNNGYCYYWCKDGDGPAKQLKKNQYHIKFVSMTEKTNRWVVGLDTNCSHFWKFWTKKFLNPKKMI